MIFPFGDQYYPDIEGQSHYLLRRNIIRNEWYIGDGDGKLIGDITFSKILLLQLVVDTKLTTKELEEPSFLLIKVMVIM